LTVLGAYQFELESKVMSEQFAVSQTSVSPGWRPKVGLLLFILALMSPLLVPWSNRGASNLGESE
jgi:hypothetical protein